MKGAFLATLALTVLSLPLLGESPRFSGWRWSSGVLEADPNVGDTPLAVGSLQKPFVAKAWALAHPGQTSPRIRCDPDSGCWNPSGHGELGLSRALEVSCNAYFHHLASQTPPSLLNATFVQEGFQGEALTPATAIGLQEEASHLAIRPSELLEAYVRLVRIPWPVGEPIRLQVLQGLREAARTGTAKALNQRGLWAKTGTIPSPTAPPPATCGLALAVDDAGRAAMARMDPGTGREAAKPLGELLAGKLQTRLRNRPTSPRDDVTVRMLELLHPEPILIRNLSPGSLPASKGFLGPGATRELSPGTWVGPGLLELRSRKTGLVRIIQGRLERLRESPGTLIATVPRRDYVAGVVAAELGTAPHPLRIQLGAAVLRFLNQGPRHREADVCDTTHCAWFMGKGPWTHWPNARSAMQEGGEITLPDEAWEAMQRLADQPGPSQWSSHCGGHPLSSRELWGRGSSQALPCPRHGPSQTRPWQRLWKAGDVDRAFGGSVTAMEIRHVEGVWKLRVCGSQGAKDYRYDEAHRRLASILGWGSLPSPAEEIHPAPGGFQVQGLGSGHRVGLCLGD